MSTRAQLFFLSTCAALFAFVFIPSVALAATISFTPGSGTHEVGNDFTVQVVVNPDGSNVNAADGTISFDASTLSVTDISRNSSSFSLWTADPTFSNSAGTISFSGGTPSAFSGQGNVLTITFRGKAVGSGAVSISTASVLAADGSGTDVFETSSGATYTITEATTPPPAPPAPEPEPEAIPAGLSDVLVPAPSITSTTHKKEEVWYATTTAILSWKVPPAMVSVRTGISRDPEEAPEDIFTPAVDTQTITDLEEGVWYFVAQFKDDFEWGDLGTYEVRIDVTPPEEFDVALLNPSDGSEPKLIFETTDALSGMARYEIHLNDVIAGTVQVKDLVDGGYPVPPQEGGPTKVTIKAYDGAGNLSEVSKTIDLPFVEKIDPRAPAQEEADAGGFRFEWVVIVVFAAIIGGLVAWQIQTKKIVEREQLRILQRVLATRERNDQVFAAMREEFEHIVDNFDEKPQLSEAERELLEDIREVIDISEEVIDSDIEELKKLIKD